MVFYHMKREWLIGRFIVPTALFLSMIAVGATIYTKLEGWSVIDAVYFLSLIHI